MVIVAAFGRGSPLAFPRARLLVVIFGHVSRLDRSRQAWRAVLSPYLFRVTCGRHNRPGIFVRPEGMGGHTASVAVACAPRARLSRRAVSSLPPAMFNPRCADHRRPSAVDGKPLSRSPSPQSPQASATSPVCALPVPASRPRKAPPGRQGPRSVPSAAMSKVRHGQHQQDAHRCDAPGGDPGRHGPRI